jgi:hypothetical protein
MGEVSNHLLHAKPNKANEAQIAVAIALAIGGEAIGLDEVLWVSVNELPIDKQFERIEDI